MLAITFPDDLCSVSQPVHAMNPSVISHRSVLGLVSASTADGQSRRDSELNFAYGNGIWLQGRHRTSETDRKRLCAVQPAKPSALCSVDNPP